MPTKTREYYLTTSSSRDFTWFFFRPPATAQPSRNTAEPTPPPYRVSKARRIMLPSITEEPGQALMAPPDARAMTRAAKSRSEPTKPKKSKSKKTAHKEAGPWSDWYVSDDRNYFWRARQSQNETWDYEFTPGYQEPAQIEDTSPTTSISELSQSPSSSPSQEDKPPGSPKASPSLNATSPKSSWPTIVTTSTGEPTDDLSPSSSRTLVTLQKELDDSNQPSTTSTALVPLPILRGNTKDVKRASNNSKRPVGPVMRLIQEGRSRKSKAKTVTTKSRGANNTVASLAKGSGTKPPSPQPPGQATGTVNLTKNRAGLALAKKLHARVKSEKELKVDPKRRVKVWLKGVEVDLTPIPLDVEGLPIYR
ncbi:hypothetical protein C8A00DRAFT_29455 [Chaetomidium leptoderma]|uniref:Uncharacterized protein n=1 Tax=Chaetomidium leptoderma TaxID=669021 RepID=A0AAN7A286_9PEZI|nr:hypothetical protein C8A00DRAFT_29455 [Chaetomidium leptoderma]